MVERRFLNSLLILFRVWTLSRGTTGGHNYENCKFPLTNISTELIRGFFPVCKLILEFCFIVPPPSHLTRIPHVKSQRSNLFIFIMSEKLLSEWLCSKSCHTHYSVVEFSYLSAHFIGRERLENLGSTHKTISGFVNLLFCGLCRRFLNHLQQSCSLSYSGMSSYHHITGTIVSFVAQTAGIIWCIWALGHRRQQLATVLVDRIIKTIFRLVLISR